MNINTTLLEVFRQNFKTKSSSDKRLVGIECEFPLVDTLGRAVKLKVIQKLFSYLNNNGFTLERDKHSDKVVQAHIKSTWGEGRFGYHQDVIATELGHSVIEFALTPSKSLVLLNEQFENLMKLLLSYCDKQGVLVLGYGVQPLTPANRNLMTPKDRYTFFEGWSSHRFIDQKDGLDCHLLTLSASNQSHIDIYEDEMVSALNVLNGLSGLCIALCANSPIWKGEVDTQWKGIREMFWEYAFTNRSHQVGIPPKFKENQEYINYICNFTPQAVKRGTEIIRLTEQESFMAFLLNEKGSQGERSNKESIWLHPQWEDIFYQTSFVWHTARLAPSHGTVEARVFCQQPPKETMCTHALTLGIIENLDEAEKLLARFPWEAWQELRFDALRHTFKAKILNQEITPLLSALLEISLAGLKKRGLNEEQFLDPLFERVRTQKSPADRAIEIFESQGLNGLLEEFSFNNSLNPKCEEGSRSLLDTRLLKRQLQL